MTLPPPAGTQSLWSPNRGANFLIANIALKPLPGSSRYAGGGFESVISQAVSEAKLLAGAGFDAVLLQNSGDGGFERDGRPETIAQLTAIGAAVKSAVACRVGFNILSVGGTPALAVAQALGGDFVRIKVYVGAVATHHGVLEGRFDEVLAFRGRIGANHIPIVADVHDRSSWPVGNATLQDTARAALNPGMAAVLVITGRSSAESLAMAQAVRDENPNAVIWCGGGVTATNVADYLSLYDGVIVARSLKPGGDYAAPFDIQLALDFVAAARTSAIGSQQ